ncbi:MAG: hypothetical protein WAT26_01125 [Saprospiraceae bacterium]
MRKQGTFDWTSKTPIKKKSPLCSQISQLDAKIKWLEAEKCNNRYS